MSGDFPLAIFVCIFCAFIVVFFVSISKHLALLRSFVGPFIDLDGEEILANWDTLVTS